MNTNTLQNVLYNTGAIAVTEYLGVPQMLFSPTDSTIIRAVKTGALWEGIDLALNQVVNGSSDLAQMNYGNILDDTTFNSLLVLGVDRLNVPQMLEGVVDKLPLGQTVNESLVSAGIKVAGKSLQTWLSAMYPTNPVLHPSHLLHY